MPLMITELASNPHQLHDNLLAKRYHRSIQIYWFKKAEQLACIKAGNGCDHMPFVTC